MITPSCHSETMPEFENMESPESKIKVSVIIPTYNRAGFLVEAIKSVLDQTFQDFEIIVVDDGSTDATRDVIKSLNNTRIRYIYQDNGGPSSARNTGIKVAFGEYIAFLDSDDLFMSQNLDQKVALLDARPDIALVCSDAYFFNDVTGAILCRAWHDPVNSNLRFNITKAGQQPLKEMLTKHCFMFFPASLVRSQIFSTVGYFDESIPASEDWDLLVRIVQKFHIDTIDMPLLKIRSHETNLSKNFEKMYMGTTAAIYKAVNSGSLSRVELKLLKQRLAFEHTRYGRWALLCGKDTLARKALLASIRLTPWSVKSYVYLVFSLPGIRRVLNIKTWAKILRHKSAS